MVATRVSRQVDRIVGPTSASSVTDRTPVPPSPSLRARDEMLSLMRALADGIRIDSLMADQLALISERARLCDEAEMADGLLEVVREHRVAALEGQGRLAALEERYAILFPDE